MQLHTRHISIVTDKTWRGCWSFNVLIGYRKPPFNKGAGYIGGATFYVCWRCVNRANLYQPRLIQIGITRNANNVPWVQS